jgi:hypothetical protein
VDGCGIEASWNVLEATKETNEDFERGTMQEKQDKHPMNKHRFEIASSAKGEAKNHQQPNIFWNRLAPLQKHTPCAQPRGGAAPRGDFSHCLPH